MTFRTNLFRTPSLESTLPVSSSVFQSVQSTYGVVSGTNSLSLGGSSTTDNDNFVATNTFGTTYGGLDAGKTYTISGYITLTAPMTGTLHDRSRRIVVFAKTPTGNYIEYQSTQAPNVAGTHRVSATFTLPTGTLSDLFIRLYHGGVASSGNVYWDAILLEEGTTLGTYFDGSTVKAGYYYGWNGSANNSTSVEDSGVRRVNLSTNPSVESNITGFDSYGGGSAQSADVAYTGTKSLKFTFTASAGQYGSGVNHPLPVEAGATYTFSVNIYVPSGQQPVVLQVQKSGQATATGTATTVYDQWERLSITWTPSTAGTGNFFILNNTATSNAKFFYADGWLVEKASSVAAYFDGNSVQNGYIYGWTGTANNSTSYSSRQGTTIASALSGSGTVTSSLAYAKNISSQLSATGVLGSVLRRNITSQLSGSGTLASKLSGYQRITSSLSGSGSLTSAVGRAFHSDFTGSGTLTSTLRRYIASGLSGSGTLTSQLSGYQKITSVLSGEGTLTSVVGKRIVSVLSGSGRLASELSGLRKQIASVLGSEGVLYSELGYVVKPAPLGTAPLGKLASFSVSTSATPLNPAEGSSSAPSVTAGYVKGLNTEFALGESNVLSHSAVGTYEGEIVRLSLPEGSDIASISQDTILTLLNNELNLFPFIDAAPSTWTAARVIDYWTQQAGLFYDKVPGDCVAYASGFGHTDSYGAGTTGRFYEKLAGGTTATQMLNGRSVKTLGSNVVGTMALHEVVNGSIPVSVPRNRKFVASAGIGLRGTGRSTYVAWNMQDGKKAAHGMVIKATSEGAVTAFIGGVPVASASVPANGNYRVTFSLEPVSTTSVVTKLTIHTDDLDGAGELVYASPTEGFPYALPAVLHLTSVEHTSEGGSGAEMLRWGTYLTVAKAHPMELPVVQKAFSPTRREFGFVSGFTGNVWSSLNEYCAITRQDVSFLDAKLTVGPRISSLNVPWGTLDRFSRDSERRDKYKQVAVVNKQSKAVATNDAVLWRADSVFQVAKREVFETTVQTGHSILSVVQPQAVDGIMPFPYKQGGGQYVVTGADGYIVSPAWWNDNGGKVEVSLTGKDGEIAIKITAPIIDTVRAPYRISEGEGDRPALYIAGSGILNDPKEVHVGTGAKNAKEGFDNVFESPFIAGPMETYDTAAAMASQYSASRAEVSFEVPNDFYTPSRFGQYPAGARFTDGKQVYRIATASQTHNKVSGDAVPNTTIGEYVASYPPGATIADEKARHSGRTIKQFNISPLRGSNGQ